MTILEAYQIIFEKSIKSEILLKASLTEHDLKREFRARLKESHPDIKRNILSTEEISKRTEKTRILLDAQDILKRNVIDIKQKNREPITEEEIIENKKNLKKLIVKARRAKTYAISKRYTDILNEMLTKCEQVDNILEAAENFCQYDAEVKRSNEELNDLLKIIDIEEEIDHFEDKPNSIRDILFRITKILGNDYKMVTDEKNYQKVIQWFRCEYSHFYNDGNIKEQKLGRYIIEFLEEATDRITRVMKLHKEKEIQKYYQNMEELARKINLTTGKERLKELAKYETIRNDHMKEQKKSVEIEKKCLDIIADMKKSTITREKYSKIIDMLLNYAGQECVEISFDVEEYDEEIEKICNPMTQSIIIEQKKYENKIDKASFEVRFALIDQIEKIVPYIDLKDKILLEDTKRLLEMSLAELIELNDKIEKYKAAAYPNKNINALREKINLYINAIIIDNLNKGITELPLEYSYENIKDVLTSYDNNRMNLFCKLLEEYCQEKLTNKKSIIINDKNLEQKKQELILLIQERYQGCTKDVKYSSLYFEIIGYKEINDKIKNINNLNLLELINLLKQINNLIEIKNNENSKPVSK